MVKRPSTKKHILEMIEFALYIKLKTDSDIHNIPQY